MQSLVIIIMCAIDFSRVKIVAHTAKLKGYFATIWITSVALVLHAPDSSSGQSVI